MKRGAAEKGKAAGAESVMARASVSFPRELYAELEQIAKHKKVSVAWVVREAAEKYVADQWPLFERHEDRT